MERANRKKLILSELCHFKSQSHYQKFQEVHCITQLQGNPHSKLLNMFSGLWEL